MCGFFVCGLGDFFCWFCVGFFFLLFVLGFFLLFAFFRKDTLFPQLTTNTFMKVSLPQVQLMHLPIWDVFMCLLMRRKLCTRPRQVCFGLIKLSLVSGQQLSNRN